MENYSEDRIFYFEDTTTTSTTTKKKPQPMFYDRVIVEKKKKGISIFIRGLLGKELEPSELRRYDYQMLNVKSGVIAVLIGVGLFFGLSKTGSEPASTKHEPTYIDRFINWISNKSSNDTEIEPAPIDEAPKQVVIVKDSLVNIDSLLRVTDSLLNNTRYVN